ncbi:ABC transporter ATP-binding protein [Sedimenticola hydrogenitrophicus]|uniref:ABC transporter ATP-binding protein n=1 Tax=Sedimenticola hydrogenitrophicus TaxID=2967975 RepID=UPI0023AFF372|nr:ABC transporter ATP-binding protein [Sedimenticola hydrogenitrophicus]
MNQNSSFVEFRNVQKSYDGKTLVVKDFNLSITRGEFVTMLGPSGSGKTTCLMMLAGFETATYGDILLDGQPINKVPPQKRGIGMVFQNYALFPHMTVAENLAFPLEVRKLGRNVIKQKIGNALEMVELGELANRRPAQLSGGQKQRVALARALVFEPKLVLMDEPLGALDKNLREQMQYEIKRIHENLGVTMVYVTHDQSEALTMSDRIAVFNDGIVQQLASPATLYEEPENAFVASFIGENNRFSGTVKSLDSDRCIVTLDDDDCNIRALPINITGHGSRAILSLRPERVVIDPEEGSLPNIFKVRAEGVTYLGDHIRCSVNFGQRHQFIIKIPNSEQHPVLKPGSDFRIGWAGRDCRAFNA